MRFINKWRLRDNICCSTPFLFFFYFLFCNPKYSTSIRRLLKQVSFFSSFFDSQIILQKGINSLGHKRNRKGKTKTYNRKRLSERVCQHNELIFPLKKHLTMTFYQKKQKISMLHLKEIIISKPKDQMIDATYHRNEEVQKLLKRLEQKFLLKQGY